MNTACRVSFLLQRFFTEQLMNQRNVSSHTIACYRDTFRLLLEFIHRQKHRVPSQLTWVGTRFGTQPLQLSSAVILQ